MAQPDHRRRSTLPSVLAMLFTLAASCAVEPIPTPAEEPVVFAPVRQQGEQEILTVIGRLGAAPAGAEVTATDLDTEAAATTAADDEGRFVLELVTSAGHRIEVTAIDDGETVTLASASALDPIDAPAGALPDPPSEAVTVERVADGVEVVGPAGSVEGGALVLAANVSVTDGAAVETEADADGGFTLTIIAAPGEAIAVFQLVNDSVSPARVLIAPDEPGPGPPPEPEICGNGLDDDSDGETDETECEPGVPCASDADCLEALVCVAGLCASAVSDADGDGFNSDVDCDDNDASVNPGTPEVPGNGIDDDCDGMIDES